ncbi:MAG: hypothetical protein MJ177_03710 [Clostridia bacterium]|nr:hypothetical protein [Clostridia bacterium]
MKKNLSVSMKALSVILGALVGGFMWRCRGESGFGSSWGLYSVGLVIILLIYQFYGNRKGMKTELIPVGALLTGLGVTGYATVIEQMSGLITSDLPYGGDEPVLLPVNPYSGMVIILIMGFTLVPLFAFFIGTLFSEKEYKITHYLIMIGIFFAVSYIAKATVAHYILKAINPEQVEYAALGLKDAGFEYSSPMQAYMKHFAQRRWTQEIPFFENYYMSIEHISDAIAVLAIALYPLIAFKDKITCGVCLIINTLTAVSTTAFSLMLAVCYDTGFLGNTPCPRALQNGAGWGIWEFSTGAAVGFFTMLIIALLPKKYTVQNGADTKPVFENKILHFIFNLALFVFVFGVVPSRVIGIRTGKLLKNLGIMDGGNTFGDIMTAVLSVIAGVLFLLMLKKNILDKGGNAVKQTPREFSFIVFPAYLVMCCVAYFCLNHGVIFFLPYKEITDFNNFLYQLTGPEHMTTTLMLITFILLTPIYLLTRKKLIANYKK